MVIYKVTNLINNKIYIGKIKKDYPEYFGSGVIIKNSIKKYGIENFKKEIIDTASSVEELNEKEKYWIKYFNSTDLIIGYNIGKGGDGGDLFTNNPNKEEIRIKYSKPAEKNGMFGRSHTEESKKKISKNRKGINKGIPTWNKGLKKENYTSEQYKKMYIERKRKNPGFLFIFLSPINQIFEVKGGFKNFCQQNILNYSMSLHFIDKGKIPPPQKGKRKKERMNLIGWEIRSLKYHKTIEPDFFPTYVKIKMSESAKKRKGKASKETREKIGNILKQRKGGENNINAKTFYLISPLNEMFVVKGQLPTFCKEHNINVNIIRNWVNKGKIPSTCKNKTNSIRENTNDWEIRTSIEAEIKNTKGYYILTSPDGNQYKLYNGLEKFCRKNNLWYETIIDYVNLGKVRQPVFKFTPERLNTVGWEIKRFSL